MHLRVLIENRLATTVAKVMEMLGCSSRVMMRRVMHCHIVEWSMASLLGMDQWMIHMLGACFELSTGEELIRTTQAVV